ncbi:MAG: RNA polymerase sigma factor [Planctomycetota bacterium]
MPSNPPESQDSGFSTSSSLVPDLQAEASERWESFVLAYSPLLRFWIRHEGIAADSVDDILQETLKSAFGAIGQFRRNDGSGSFRGWLRTIVRRRAADHFRRHTGEQQGKPEILAEVPVPAQKDPAELEAEENAVEALKARVMELVRRETSEKAWRMFWLSAVEGLPASEIAARFGVSAAAVRVAKARVLHKLRQLMPDPE